MNILIITKKSRYEVYQEITDEGERSVMLQEANGMQDMLREHDSHYSSLEMVLAALQDVPHDVVRRADVSAIQDRSLIISVGGDGTFLNASHYLTNGTPIMGINSVPWKSRGVYCYGTAGMVMGALSELDKLPRTELSRMRAVQDGVAIQEPILNEVILRHLHLGSSWWTITDGESETLYKYPYLLMVATPAGSTGGMFNLEGELLPLDAGVMQYRFVGLLDEPSHFAQRITIRSRTNRGLYQADGYHIRHEFPYGSMLELSLDAPPLTVIGDLRVMRKGFEDDQRRHLLRLRDDIDARLKKI